MISLPVSALLAWQRLLDRPKLAGPGIDVSKHQGRIDWLAAYADLHDVGEGTPWVYVKATEGEGYFDPQLERNAMLASQAGFDVGAYHFARIDSGANATKDANDEVDDFIDTIEHLPLSLRPCLDIELGGIKRRDFSWCRRWWVAACRRVHERTGVWPLIYTGYWSCRWIWRNRKARLDMQPALADLCPLWQPEYTNGKRPRKKLGGRGDQRWDPLIWQHTSKGRIAGIPGRVDRNVVLGTDHEFAKLRMPANGVA